MSDKSKVISLATVKEKNLLKKIEELKFENSMMRTAYFKLKDTQKELKISEQQYRHLYESANDAIFMMDGKNFIDCNKKTLDIYGCSKREEIIGKTPLDFSPEFQPDSLRSQRKALKHIRLALKGRPQRFYWQHLKNNGEEFDAEVSLNKVKFGKKTYVQAIVRDITKERQALNKLKKSEESLSLAQKVGSIGYWDWDLITDNVERSDQLNNILGVDKSFVLTYKSFLKIIHRDDRKRVKSTIENSLRTGLKYKVDHRIITPKGKEKIIYGQGKVVFNKKNKAIRMLGLLRDITKSKLAEDKIRENENRLQTLFENNRDALFIAEANTRKLVAANKQAIILTGYSKKELFSMKADDLHPKDMVKEAIKGFKKQAKGEQVIMETEVLTKNSKRVAVSIGVSTYVGTDGKLYTQGSFRDVTVQRKAEAQLKDSEQKFRTIVENAQAIIFILDKDGKFVLSEGKKLSVLSLKPGQVVGMSALEMYKNFPRIVKGITNAISGKSSRIISKVGEIYFDIFYSPYKDENGSNIGMIGMAIDVTSSETARETLIAIDKSKSEFISMASHQLRTPLGNIRWELESLLKEGQLVDEKKVKESLKSIYKHDLRLIDLVNNLLNISRIENQRVMDKPKKFDVVKMVREILDESHVLLSEKKISVYFKESEKMNLTYDPKLFREVISNLITNAIKFNRKSGIVVIKLDKENEKFNFRVCNTGHIISKLDHEHLFEKFYRGSNPSEIIAGTGLGLHIAKSYVDKWNGTITVKSPATFSERSVNGDKYKGTMFSIKLPTSAKR